jgi:hypothetical protein
MHHSIVWQHGNDTVAESLVTDAANTLLRHHHPSVAPALSAGHPIPKKQQRLRVDQHCSPQALYNSTLGQLGVGSPDTASKVRLQVLGRQIVGDK